MEKIETVYCDKPAGSLRRRGRRIPVAYGIFFNSFIAGLGTGPLEVPRDARARST
jgi:hypothetical protein